MTEVCERIVVVDRTAVDNLQCRNFERRLFYDVFWPFVQHQRARHRFLTVYILVATRIIINNERCLYIK